MPRSRHIAIAPRRVWRDLVRELDRRRGANGDPNLLSARAWTPRRRALYALSARSRVNITMRERRLGLRTVLTVLTGAVTSLALIVLVLLLIMTQYSTRVSAA